MVQLDHYQSNHEGDLIDYLHEHGFEQHTGIILNAGAYSHTSIALRDAISAIDVPVVEVHISDITKREPFRAHSFLTEVSVESIFGKGMEGYRMAIDHLLALQES
jgi:3-dehydroquinate dehydratase II